MAVEKTRLLYFDASLYAKGRFIHHCTAPDKVELVGVFPALTAITPQLRADRYQLLRLLQAEVAVIRVEKDEDTLPESLRQLKSAVGIKLIGLVASGCRVDTSAFDYVTEEAGAENIRTEEDTYTRLSYQIRSAKLSYTVEHTGMKGKWAILPPPHDMRARRFDLFVIGASAGGTEALTTILSALPNDLPPILIVQHMPENFPDFFAKNLSAKVAGKVLLAQDGARAERGHIYLADSGKHLTVKRGTDGAYRLYLQQGEKVSGHCPSVDVLFRSAASAAGERAVGIILTGMGADGAQGLLEMRQAGAYTIGQDKESSTVYGMPMMAYNMGAVSKQLPLASMARAIITAAGQSRGEETKP